MKPRILFLFPQEWDQIALRALEKDYEVLREGFDLFSFPDNAQLMWFDARRYVARLARKYRHAGLAGVTSTNEQWGALVAACVARELALPGTDPAAIIRSQHKFYARQLLERALPGANPRFSVFHYDVREPEAVGLEFPLFVKPVKAAFSVLARRIDSFAALRAHVRFRPWEKHVIKRLVRPFNDLMRQYTDFTVDAHHLLAEELMGGWQVNVDGWVHDGRVGILGVVDAVMYPGTDAFLRFEYPSTLRPSIQSRMHALAGEVVRAVGFDHGLFNVEMFYDPVADTLRVIEINPRFAAQFGDMYRKVAGIDPYRLLFELATGQSPRTEVPGGECGAAASFVFREFDGAVKVAPGRAELAWLEEHYPDALLNTYIKAGGARAREMKWLGSYRYAVINLGGRNREDLFARFEHICRHVRFSPGPGSAPMPVTAHPAASVNDARSTA